MALLESNFEKGGTKMELHGELSYGQLGGPFWLFLSQCVMIRGVLTPQSTMSSPTNVELSKSQFASISKSAIVIRPLSGYEYKYMFLELLVIWKYSFGKRHFERVDL